MLGIAGTSTPGALAASPPLQTVMDWTPFPADASAINKPGAVFADSPARIGLVLSTDPKAPVSSGGPVGWTRAQFLSLDSGRPKSALFTVPAFLDGQPFSPSWMDETRGLFIYAAPKEPAGAGTPPSGWDIVGISMNGPRRIAFDVPSRFTAAESIVGLAPSDDGRDVIVMASPDRHAAAYGGGVAIDRVAIAGLQHGTLQSRWQSPYRAPETVCPSPISTNDVPAVLAFGDKVVLGCRQASTGVDGFYSGANRTPPGAVVLSGLSASSNATVHTAYFPAPGNFNAAAESFADRADDRLVLTDNDAAGMGARVFDAVHERYVGRVPLGSELLGGAVIDQKTGRFYAGSADFHVGLAETDLHPVVPTQGLVAPPYSSYFSGGNTPMLDYDDVRHNVLIPMRQGATNHVLVVHDSVPRYVPPTAANPDAGALDVAEQPGVTDSQRSAVAQAYGADYQVIGGTANLVSSVAIGDHNQIPPGTNFLRQAEVTDATLTSDESTAQSILASEDRVTEQQRTCVGIPQIPCAPVPTQAGVKPTFADPATCSDFGSDATKGRDYKDTAFVSCNFNAASTEAGSSFVSDGALFMTSSRTEPVPAPVQVSRSSTQVSLKRTAGLGAVTTTVTATADGISIAGGIRIGSVSNEITLTTHGRPGTSSVDRKVVVNDVTVGGTTVCTRDCSSDTVQSAINTAQPGRLRVEFPSAQTTKSPGGTFVGVVQDPWYHAERVLDAEKVDTDYAVPAMTITVVLDSGVRSRLVVDLAGADATDSYRIYSLGKQAPFLAPISAKVGPPAPLHLPGTMPASLPTPSVVPAVAQSGGFGTVLASSARFLLASPGRMLALLPVFLLLGVPVYLSARRRLLLELPLLSRDEGLS